MHAEVLLLPEAKDDQELVRIIPHLQHWLRLGRAGGIDVRSGVEKRFWAQEGPPGL